VRLLFVCERVPWPAQGGAAVKTLGQLRALTALGHRIELLAFGSGAPPSSPLGLDLELTVVPSPPERSVADWLRTRDESVLPWTVRQRASAAMTEEVARAAVRADAVVAVGLSMVQHVEGVAGGLRVYDALDVESLTARQVARAAVDPLLRVHSAGEADVIERYERDLAVRTDLVTAVTEVDAAGLHDLAPDAAVETVPIGLSVVDYPLLWQPGTPRLAFFGDLGWPPNVDAAIHLCRDVLPLLDRPPRLTISGRRPAPEIEALAGDAVEVTGAVPEMAPVLAGDTIAVAPLRAGTGMRVKLLEAMAWGLPTVSSSLGCAGIEHGGALVEADGAEATAAAIAALLGDAERRSALSAAGRALVAERYGHERSGDRLVAAIERRQRAVAPASRR
jgi:polysaccharide biosynthesis protein PslH